MNQGIIVFSDLDGFRAIGRITHETLFASPEAHETIQFALDAMQEDGGEVALEQGRYPIQQPIRLRSHVRLYGAGRATRLIASEAAAVIAETLDSAEIANLALISTVEHPVDAGLILDGCGNCRADNIFAAGFAGHGIWLRGHSFLCEIHACSAAGNGRSNIFLDTLASRGRAGEFIPNLVSNCMIYRGGKGIECRNTIVANIVGCCVFQTADTGFHVHSESNSVLVTGCRTFQVGKHAVLLEDTDEFNLSSNIFCWHIEDGVVIRNANWGAITGNEIIDSGSYNSGVRDSTAEWSMLPTDLPPYSGIKLLNAHGYTVSGNTIFNWPVVPPMEYGIYEDGDSFKNNITGNNSNYFTRAGVASHGRESLVAHNVEHAERPHQDREPLHRFFQTFEVGLTDRFLANQLGHSLR